MCWSRTHHQRSLLPTDLVATAISARRPWLGQVYWFSVAAVTRHHKLGGLKQHKLSILQFRSSEVKVSVGSYSLKVLCETRSCPSWLPRLPAFLDSWPLPPSARLAVMRLQIYLLPPSSTLAGSLWLHWPAWVIQDNLLSLNVIWWRTLTCNFKSPVPLSLIICRGLGHRLPHRH